MDDTAFPLSAAHEGAGALLSLAESLRAHAKDDPFGSPVLATAFAILRRMRHGDLTEEAVEALIVVLRDQAFADRAKRLAAYVGGTEATQVQNAYAALAYRIVRPDPTDSPVQFAEFRAAVERTRFAAVFTAHPTFANPAAVYQALAEQACGTPAPAFASHRPTAPTIEDEFLQASHAIAHARDALDRLNASFLEAARAAWPNRWHELSPCPVVIASWVGYDTDGRVDIQWWDTLKLRLRCKLQQFTRLREKLGAIASAQALSQRLDAAAQAVEGQIAACPAVADADAVAAFAHRLIAERETALTTIAPLRPLFDAALTGADADEQMRLRVAWAGLQSHGLSIANTHVRLNAAQIHNAVRLRLGLEDPPADPFRRRVLLAAVNEALEKVTPVPVDFGALLAEQASATRLIMTVAQIAKHIDADAPVRFLVAETESGYTLLSTLWLARLFGVDTHIEISPLFETAEALENGAQALEEALRSSQYRAYLRRIGRLCIQFGYSDSGRYVGQLAATFLIERLRLKIADLMARHALTDIELVLFDTHGESIGRGAHPGSLTDRLKYLSPTTSRQAFTRAGVAWRDESAFQGGDGYLLFDTPGLAGASIARIAEHAFDVLPTTRDPIYEEGDFAAGFFASIGASMRDLVEDPGYAALLGAFGPALLDTTGSRPPARHSEGMNGPAVIRHPRELRAIPNNAILQQLGWFANTLHGLGAAAARQPELFAELRAKSPRFRRALELAMHALKHSDIDVLRASIALLDPGAWLDLADHESDPEQVQQFVAVSRSLVNLDLWAPAQAMFRRIQTDHVLLRAAWPEAPHMSTRETLLHALRIALIQRIWLTAMQVPDFSPRHGLTRQALGRQLLQLDVPKAIAFLREVFPDAPDPSVERDYGEPQGPRITASYAREHQAIFQPMLRLFGLIREISTAISHEVGAFG